MTRIITASALLWVGCGGGADGPRAAAEVVDPPEGALAAGRAGPVHVAVADGTVIWTEAGGPDGVGGVYQVPIGGGEITDVIDGETGVRGLAVHNGEVFWTAWAPERPDRGLIRSRPLAGGGAALLAVDQSRPGAIGVGAGGVFWSNDRATPGGSGAILRGVPGGSEPFAAGDATDLAVGDTHLFWTDGTVVKRQPLVGGAPEVLGVAGPSTVALALDDTRVFWVAGDASGQVLRAPQAGGNATELVAGTVIEPRALTLSDDAVYFAHRGDADGGAAGIAVVSKVGGGHRAVAQNGQPVGGVATDGATLVWTEPETGLVRAIALP